MNRLTFLKAKADTSKQNSIAIKAIWSAMFPDGGVYQNHLL